MRWNGYCFEGPHYTPVFRSLIFIQVSGLCTIDYLKYSIDLQKTKYFALCLQLQEEASC